MAPNGVVTAWFEAGEPPVVLWPATLGRPTATWTTPDHTEGLTVAAEPTRVRLGSPSQPGKGILSIQSSTCVLSTPAVWRPKPADNPRLKPIDEAAAAGRWSEVEALLTALEADSDEGVWALGRHATLVLRSGDRDRGMALFAEGGRRALQAGHYTEAAALIRAAAFQDLSAHRYAEAGRRLDEAESVARGHHDPKGQARLLFYRASLEAALLRAHQAEKLDLEAVEEAVRIGDTSFESTVRDAWAARLSRRGQHQAALAALPPAQASSAYLTWGLALNRAWYHLEAVRSCQLPDPPSAVQAETLALAQAPPPEAKPSERANAWVNAAYAAHLAGDDAAARKAMAEVWTADPAGGLDPAFAARLAADLQLAAGDLAGAAAAFEALLASARLHPTGPINDDVWRALDGLGRVALARGDRTVAEARWREAAEALDAVSERIDLQAGRAPFHADRRALLDGLLTLLLESGRPQEALDVADRFAAPVLRSLEREAGLAGLEGAELARWGDALQAYEEVRAAEPAKLEACALAPLDEVPACEAQVRALRAQAAQRIDAAHALAGTTEVEPFVPSALAPDEAVLAFVPTRARGHCETRWHGLMVVAGRTQEVSAQPIEMLQGLPKDIRHIYVLDGGYAAARALPEALIDGTPAAARWSLSFLPRLSWLRHRGPPVGGGGLVVADPNNDLKFSLATGETLAHKAPLMKQEAATRAAVLAGLHDLRWLHFDGHGDVAPDDPWAAYLKLADGTLTLADVLAHRPRMGTVVLSACHTAEAGTLSATEAIGLPEAFLLAGADQVLAAMGEPRDEEAAAVMARFYAEGGATDATQARQRTVQALSAEGNEGWRRWRFFGRR